jgi:hypothetical protein
MPELERDALRDLCGQQGGRDRGRCRAAMSQLESACDGDPASEDCAEAIDDAVAACHALQGEDTATACDHSIQLLSEALGGQEVQPQTGDRDDDDDRDDDRNRDPDDDNRDGDNEDGDQEDDGGDDGDRDDDDNEEDGDGPGRWWSRRGLGGGEER